MPDASHILAPARSAEYTCMASAECTCMASAEYTCMATFCTPYTPACKMPKREGYTHKKLMSKCSTQEVSTYTTCGNEECKSSKAEKRVRGGRRADHDSEFDNGFYIEENKVHSKENTFYTAVANLTSPEKSLATQYLTSSSVTNCEAQKLRPLIFWARSERLAQFSIVVC